MKMTEEAMKLQRGLSIGLKEIGIQKDTSIAIALMLRTENQLLTMLDWIVKHKKENPSEDRVLRIAQKISEQVK